jgi:anti-sigma factor RsiW
VQSKKQIPSITRMNHKGAYNLGRSSNQHIDSSELNALVPSRFEAGSEIEADLLLSVIEAQRHVAICPECKSKVQKYSHLVNRSQIVRPNPAPPRASCPQDIDWHEIASGLWPELKATQLMMHAAQCEHCGPLLCAATRARCNPAPQKDTHRALNAPRRRDPALRIRHRSQFRPSIKWLAPAAALIAVAAVLLGTRPTSSPTSLSGVEFAELAVTTHRQYAQGKLALDIRSNSQQALNQWLKAKSPFLLALPASPAAPGEERPYHPEGARLVQVGGNRAAFLAYEMETPRFQRTPPAAASLMVIPDSAAKAAGGFELRFAKVSFHYATIDGYKVVTWSVHGLTYALVSDEGNNTQRSCMVCHSAMRDRDLSHTPTPLLSQKNIAEPVWQ